MPSDGSDESYPSDQATAGRPSTQEITMLAPSCISHRGAAIDDYTADDYLRIYHYIKGSLTYRQLIAKLGSDYSPAWWARYQRGEMHLTRTAKNELRRFYTGKAISPTIIESIAEMDVSPEIGRAHV